jgi:hypothetical protein
VIYLLVAADCRSRRLSRSPEINNFANRYSSAICMRRARRSAVSALRASSKQHSAKRSNCLVKVALIARNQRRRIEEVPGDCAVVHASLTQIRRIGTTVHNKLLTY